VLDKRGVHGVGKEEAKMNIDDAHENLANAIVEQAVKDYRIAKKKGDSSKIASLRRFFRSEWFGVLTMVDPEWLISKLEREFKKRGAAHDKNRMV
jgi:hypothetical protein